MKTSITHSALRLCIILATLWPFTTINAYDFEVNRLQYTITSENTVSVTGNSIDILGNEEIIDIEIPSQVTHNNIDYSVTAIGDSAFYSYYEWRPGLEDYNIGTCFNVTIPETIISIGFDAFGGYCDLVNLICLAKTPPHLNNSFNAYTVNLFVYEDSYSTYEEFNNENHYFSSIFITNGERSETPEYEIEYLDYPDNLAELASQYDLVPFPGTYGCDITFTNENSEVFTRSFDWRGGAQKANYRQEYGSPYFEFSNGLFYENCLSINGHSYLVQSYALEHGKSPSSGVIIREYFSPKFEMSFSFKETGVAYNIKEPHELEVTYSCYYGFGGEKSAINNLGLQKYSENKSSYSTEVSSSFYILNSYFFLYSGDVVIPSIVNPHKTDISYRVTSIGDNAFSPNFGYNGLVECLEYQYGITLINSLISVTLPSSIISIGKKAFEDCPNLDFIKCLGAVPASASDDSFDQGVYQNTTLYVPLGSLEAYRAANGWKNFLNIVESIDNTFEVDGIYFKQISEEEVIVTRGEDAYQGVVSIPSTVTYEGVTYNVSGIIGGTFSNATLQSLTLPVSLSSIDENAFNGCHIGSLIINSSGTWTAGAIDCDIDNLYVMSTVTGIQNLTVNPVTTVYSYSTMPPTCNEQTFIDYNAELHVPASALAAYFTAPYWSNFINIVPDAVEPTGLTVNADSVEVLVGNQQTLTTTPIPADATPDDVIWIFSDESIATVTDAVITAVHTGECDIKAYLLDKSTICHVTITEIAPTEVTLSQEFAKLEIGSQLTLTATVSPDDATDKVVTWTTTNSAVATVDSLGTVTAVGSGECFITATCRDKQATCHIIVVDHFVFITLDEHEVRLMPNHMAILTPSVMPEGTTLVVTSSNPDVAAARMANGKIQVVGIAEGRTVITVNSTDGYAEADSCLVKVYTLRGDVNGDGFVNIADVTALISYVLNGKAEGIILENADTNNDGGVNIADVTKLISAVLSGKELDPKDEPIEGAETFTVNGVTFTMMPVEGGTYTMGATPEQGTSDPWNDERPTHEVTLSTYSIGETEVTQALWQAVMGSNPSEFTGNLNRPVEMVSWEDCQTFIAQLNQMTGRTFRLPTEAEWEYAARGGNKTQGYKYAGGDDIEELAWWDTNAGDGVGSDSPDYGTHPVAVKKANELGLYDMSGNVWEWCQDWYGSYSSEAQTNPTGPATGTNRVYRGGSWFNYARNCRVSSRYHWTMNGANYIGLRLAL